MKTLRSFIAALGIAIVPVAVARSSGTTMLEDIDHRQATSLNGEWNTIVVPYFAGYFNFHHEIRTDGFYRNAPRQPDSIPPVEYIGWYQDAPQGAERFTWQMAYDKR